jgi:hypothetical protein
MTIIFILGGMFIFSIIGFLGGMFLFPEIFGISKGKKTETPQNGDNERK